jgi:hypothetical protein
VARLFARYFLVPAEDPEREPPSLAYDEGRSLNLDASGRVAVEAASAAANRTLTEVRGEHEDPDDDFITRMGTSTKARGEADDRFLAMAVGTETRAAAEQEDRVRGEYGLGTRTSIPNEAEDFNTAASMLGTETAIRGEAEDFCGDPPMAGTRTYIEAESEDFARAVLDDAVREGRGMGREQP